MNAPGRFHVPCHRCAALEEELAYLKAQLGLDTKAETANTLAAAFGLTRHLGKVMAQLYKADAQRFVSRETIALLSDRTDDPNAAEQHVTRLRRILGKEAIETLWGRGWRLSADMRARCCAVLSHSRQSGAESASPSVITA